MSRLINSALALALLGSVPAIAFAQMHGPQHGRDAQQARHNQTPRYREVNMSQGHRWQRGQRLASQRRFVVNDWNQRGLRAPPRGYRWVRENNNSGDYLLVAVASGLIASILTQ